MKNFLVINTSFFGDVLLTDTLCQNIKLAYPGSNIIFMVNKPFYEAAKYMAGVDEVVCYDKAGIHKGLAGILTFLREHWGSLKDRIDAAFVLYGNERGICIAKALGAHTIISDNRGLFHYLFSTISVEKGLGTVQQENTKLIKALTHQEAVDLPIRYTPPLAAETYAQQLFGQWGIRPQDELVGLCTTSKRAEKDMPLSTAVEVITALQQTGKKVVYLGAGPTAAEYAAELRSRGCCSFIDLTDKTSIAELAAVIQSCAAVISVDTGTLHLTCASGVPLVALFYVNDCRHLAKWAPAKYYPHVLLSENITAANILHSLQTLLVSGGTQ